MSSQVSSAAPTKKFVLLSLARSGTTMTMRTIRRHPDVYVHMSPFARNANPGQQIEKQFYETHLDSGLPDDPMDLLEKILAFSPGEPVVGFKMWWGQNKDVCRAVLADTSIQKVILERENVLASYTSRQLSTQQGSAWHKLPNSGAETVQRQCEFDQKTFLKDVNHRKSIFEKYRRLAKGDVLDVPYTSLSSGGLVRIGEFLDLKDFVSTPDLAKLHSSNILSRIKPEYHDSVISTLAEIGHSEWAMEGSD